MSLLGGARTRNSFINAQEVRRCLAKTKIPLNTSHIDDNNLSLRKITKTHKNVHSQARQTNLQMHFSPVTQVQQRQSVQTTSLQAPS